MENATKALLIAAAVLIAIVLIALGVNLVSSTGDTTEDVGKVSEQVGTSTNSAVSSLDTALGRLEGLDTEVGDEVILDTEEEKKLVTFYVDEEVFEWPVGKMARELWLAGEIDESRWSCTTKYLTLDGSMICSIKGDFDTYVNPSLWKPTEGGRYYKFDETKNVNDIIKIIE